MCDDHRIHFYYISKDEAIKFSEKLKMGNSDFKGKSGSL